MGRSGEEQGECKSGSLHGVCSCRAVGTAAVKLIPTFELSL